MEIMYSPQEENFIKSHYMTMTYSDIAAQLNKEFHLNDKNEIRNELSVAMKIKHLGLKKRNFKKFTNSEIKLMIQLSNYYGYNIIGQVLKRSGTAVFNKLNSLGYTTIKKNEKDLKKQIQGLEDLIMFLNKNLKKDSQNITKYINQKFKKTLSSEMIDSYIIVNEKEYSKKWKFYNLDLNKDLII